VDGPVQGIGEAPVTYGCIAKQSIGDRDVAITGNVTGPEDAADQ